MFASQDSMKHFKPRTFDRWSLFPAVGKQGETALSGTEVLRGEKLQNIRFIAMLMKALDA